MQFVTVTLAVDPSDIDHIPGQPLRPIQLGALVRARLGEILTEEDDAELATRLDMVWDTNPPKPAPKRKRVSPQREAHLQLHSRLADGSRCPQCNYLAATPPHDPSRCSACAEAEYR
jgi:hypothetical protein